MKRARRKTTESKRQRKKIAREAWDFRRVKDDDVEFVHMREYARECLRAWDEDELEFIVFTKGLSRNNPEVEPNNVLGAVRKGIEARADGAKPPRREPIPTLEHVPVYRARRPIRALPTGCFVVCLQIDWRAGNKQIKAAFEDWLEGFTRSRDDDMEATQAYHVHLARLAKPIEEQDELIDYCDLADAIYRFTEAKPIADKVGWPITFVLKELRRGVGTKRGRGDAKRAMLTDLAVSRLWKAGKTPAEIRRLMGKTRLKYSEPAQILRAVKQVRRRVRHMLISAEFVEQVVAKEKAERKIDIPPEAFKEARKT